MWESHCDVSVPSRFSCLAIHHGLAFLQGPFRNSGVAFINGFPYLSVGSSTLPLDVSRRALEQDTHSHQPLPSRFLRSASRHSILSFFARRSGTGFRLSNCNNGVPYRQTGYSSSVFETRRSNCNDGVPYRQTDDFDGVEYSH